MASGVGVFRWAHGGWWVEQKCTFFSSFHEGGCGGIGVFGLGGCIWAVGAIVWGCYCFLLRIFRPATPRRHASPPRPPSRLATTPAVTPRRHARRHAASPPRRHARRHAASPPRLVRCLWAATGATKQSYTCIWPCPRDPPPSAIGNIGSRQAIHIWYCVVFGDAIWIGQFSGPTRF